MTNTMKNPCSILCQHYMMAGDHPSVCTNEDAILDNETSLAVEPDCKHFQMRPGHKKAMEALENRIHTITFEIDADLVEESNRMWRRRFAIAAFVLVVILDIGYLFLELT